MEKLDWQNATKEDCKKSADFLNEYLDYLAFYVTDRDYLVKIIAAFIAKERSNG